MNNPTIAGIKSIPIEMEVGVYKWCSCGLSKTQPFCDDSHIGTEFLPTEVEITEARRYSWCACKQSGKKPFCDGTHKQLPEHIAYMEMIATQASITPSA